MDLPAPTPNFNQSLTQQQLDKHRALIGVAVEVILDGYWKDRPAPNVKREILIDWMNQLQGWHIDQIKVALGNWRNSNPDKKPNAGHILKMLKAARGVAYVNQKEGRKPDPLFAIDRPLMLAAE